MKTETVKVSSVLNHEYLLQRELFNNPDVVFLCKHGETVAFQKVLLCRNFPLFQEILPSLGPADFYLEKGAKTFISMDAVEAKDLKDFLLSSLYINKKPEVKNKAFIHIETMLKGHPYSKLKKEASSTVPEAKASVIDLLMNDLLAQVVPARVPKREVLEEAVDVDEDDFGDLVS